MQLPRLWLLMKNRIFPTALAATLFWSVAVFEIGPQAAPLPSTPNSQTPKIASPQDSKLAKYEPARGAYLGAALDFSGLQSEGSRATQMAAAMGAWEKQSFRENAIYVGFQPFPHADGSFPEWSTLR